ncbi:hypothetical protein lerEdw1_019992 [Lerista edwardsae]|nr:hypothetical protein lerEdw1_019992 [Lerista edwardsae]
MDTRLQDKACRPQRQPGQFGLEEAPGCRCAPRTCGAVWCGAVGGGRQVRRNHPSLSKRRSSPAREASPYTRGSAGKESLLVCKRAKHPGRLRFDSPWLDGAAQPRPRRRFACGCRPPRRPRPIKAPLPAAGARLPSPRPDGTMILQRLPGPSRDGVAHSPASPLPSTGKNRFDIESLLAKPEPPRRSSLVPSAWAAASRFGCPVLPFPAVYLAEQPPALLSASPPHRPCAQSGCKRQGLAFSHCAVAGSHLGAPLPWRAGGPCKAKRVRTVFTPEQLERLEKEFLKQQYMVGTERVDLAATLHLTETQVKVWFQNRRIKWRKQSLQQKAAQLSQLGVTQPAPAERPDGRDSDQDGGEAPA